MARLLLLSPYHGGSHRAFAEGLQRHSSHRIDLLSLPPRFWKWRMRGAGMLLARRARRARREWDLILATDMMNLAEFRALSGLANRPHVLYFHENQLAYPLPENDRADLHYGFINLASAEAAERLVFNSRFHREAFFSALPRHLAAMPDCPLPDPVPALRRRARVLPVGCELREVRRAADGGRDAAGPPVILWNHRWEFDKDPETFFAVIDRLAAEGLEFRLILAGECSQVKPKAFLAARERHRGRILSYGYVPDRRDYARLLGRADIVVSTAVQENFGVAVVEAMAAGAWPLLPRRLSYPEVLPGPWHGECLYDGLDELHAKLVELLKGKLPAASRREDLARRMLRYDWSALIATYDDLLTGLLPRPGVENH